jgi:thioredoxin 1
MINTIDVTDDSFEHDVLHSEVPVLVDFWAEWCGPCKMVSPSLEQIARERDGKILIAKVNVDENPRTAESFGIMSIPTLVFFAEGKPVEGTVGAAPYGALNDWIGELLDRVA